VASLFFLGISLIIVILDVIYALELAWLIIITFFGYAVLLTLFLHFNHELTKRSESRLSSSQRYETAIIACSILLLIGIIGSVIGTLFNTFTIQYFMMALASGSFVALIYGIVGLFDVKKKLSKE
jgi:hypothetical protein